MRIRTVALVAVAALVLAGGCGGDDGAETTVESPVSEEEFSQEIQQIDREVSQAFGGVFETGIDELPPDARVPPAARDALERAAEAEREGVERLEQLEPPEDAQAAVDGLIEEGSSQADRLAEAAENEDLTIGELQRAFEQDQPERYLDELRELGYLPDEESGGGGGGESEPQ